jgi:hypothetical protein
MKPFLTPHASVRRPQSARRPPQIQPARSMRSTVLLSLLLVPRSDERGDESRDR